MKFALACLVVAGLAACASPSVAPAGMPAGKFVSFACADGKVFSARAAEGGTSVRVRSQHGSAELDRKADGLYEGDGFRLVAEGSGSISLTHDGKTQGKNCRPAA